MFLVFIFKIFKYPLLVEFYVWIKMALGTSILCLTKPIQAYIIFIFYLSQSDDSDIWDDTALIKAYDKAVASFKVWNT